jgi:hypothetical protein
MIVGLVQIASSTQLSEVFHLAGFSLKFITSLFAGSLFL